MKKNILNVIKCFIFILLIVIIVIIGIIYKIKKDKKNNIEMDLQATPSIGNIPVYIDSTLHKVNIRNNYYVVKYCIETFFDEYSLLSSGDDEVEKKLYSMLDSMYIEKNQIKESNIKEKLTKIPDVNVNINNMYVCEIDENISVYFVEVNLENKTNSKRTDTNIMVITDLKNKTFSIILNDYIRLKYNVLKEGENISLENIPEKIENRNFNTFDYKIITDKMYLEDIINVYKQNVKNNPEVIFNKLNIEYKEKKFNKIEKFKSYINKHIDNIYTMELKDFSKNKYEEYIQYICIDNNDNYFIINEIAPMEYNLILDTYTIDLPIFKQNYLEQNVSTKVAMNLEKIKSAINYGDYDYVYSKIDLNYKIQNYSNYLDFEKYISETFFSNNEFKYKNIELQDSKYFVSIECSDKETNENKIINVFVIIEEDINFKIII